MANRSTKNLKKTKKIPTAVLIALIGLVGKVITALMSSPIIVTLLTPKKLPPPKVEIIGPETAPFGKTTYYNIVSENATRAEWSIGGFQDNQVFEVNPLGPSHKIYVEPTNNEYIGEVFVIAVTVYNKQGDVATATKQFTVVSNNP